MLKELLGTDKSTKPTMYSDPFTKECVEGIHIHASKGWFTEKFWFRGIIKFKNGNTKGEQTFEGSSIEDLLTQMKVFSESL